MVRLESVNSKNVWSLLKLHVGKEQEAFVAPNDLSIIEAYISITSNGHAYPFGIFDGALKMSYKTDYRIEGFFDYHDCK